MNYNRVESVLPRTTRPRVDNRGKTMPETVDNRPVLENLEVLHLASVDKNSRRKKREMIRIELLVITTSPIWSVYS